MLCSVRSTQRTGRTVGVLLDTLRDNDVLVCIVHVRSVKTAGLRRLERVNVLTVHVDLAVRRSALDEVDRTVDVLVLVRCGAPAALAGLEDQEGFPQFNARFEEYKEKRREREIMDPYELRKRELQRTSTGEMSDLGTTQDELAQYEKVHVQSNMDSI